MEHERRGRHDFLRVFVVDIVVAVLALKVSKRRARDTKGWLFADARSVVLALQRGSAASKKEGKMTVDAFYVHL